MMHEISTEDKNCCNISEASNKIWAYFDDIYTSCMKNIRAMTRLREENKYCGL